MAFSVKTWQNAPSTATPLNGAGLIDLETRLSAYTDASVATAISSAHTDAVTLANAAQSAAVQPGDLKVSAAPSAPAGWLTCDGSAVSRTTYNALFSAVGTTYGAGDGSTSFNVPDLRGRVPVGAGTGVGGGTTGTGKPTGGTTLTTRALGNWAGGETITLAIADLPSHNHGGATGGMNRNDPHQHYITGYPNTVGPELQVTNMASPVANASATQFTSIAHEHAISAQGGGGAHSNVQPCVVFNWLIKT